MHALRHGRRDPFWDLEGAAAKRSRLRRKIVGAVALAIAIVACGLTTAAWLMTVGPVILRLVDA